MNQWKKAFLDSGLIIIGASLSTWFISTDGNGQNPVPVLAGMLFVTLIAGLISFILARFVHSIPLSVIASLLITDFLFVLYFICHFVFSQRPHEHGNEELILLPIVFVVETAPTILFACIGFGRFASRFYRRKDMTAKPR